MTALAQETFPEGIAEYVPLAEEPLAGSIIVLTANGYELSLQPYDDRQRGVVTRQASIAVGSSGIIGTYPLVKSGTSRVRVNGKNGPIAIGSSVTSSSTSGVGMKAERAGFIVGRALEAFDGSTESDTGLIRISLDVQWADPRDENTLTDIPSLWLQAVRQGPGGILPLLPLPVRYVLGFGVAALSIVIAYWLFTRTITTSVAAVGRNPLAKASILSVAILHLTLMLALSTVGIILGVFLIIL